MSRDQETHRTARLGGRMSDTAWTRTRAILSLGMVLGLGAVGTMAAWSGSTAATSGMFSTGTIRLELNGENPSYGFAGLNKTSLLRGNSVAAMLPVKNAGSTAFSYVAKATASGDSTLASNFTVAVFVGGGSNGGTTCSGGASVNSKALSTTAPVDLIPARTLAAAGTDNLCFQVTLNSSAPIESRMKTLSAAFQFTATSVPAGA